MLKYLPKMKIIDNNNAINVEAWERLVEQSPVASWFQTHDAYEFFAALPSIMSPFVFAVQDNNELKGVVVGYITKEKNPFKQYFSRRAIIYGGPLLAVDITEDELTALLNALCVYLKDKAIYVETRNFNDYSLWRPVFEKVGFTYQPHLNFHVDTISNDVIDSNLSKNRKRDIRVSMRDGAQVIETPSLEQVRGFYSLLRDLYIQKVKTPLYPWEFFQTLYYSSSAKYLLVEYNGKILGGTLCVFTKATCYEWFVCGDDEHAPKTIFPSELATYGGLVFASKQGCTRFDMMGAGVPDEPYGVRDFKARFGGELVQHGRFLRIMSTRLYKIGNLGVLILRLL